MRDCHVLLRNGNIKGNSTTSHYNQISYFVNIDTLKTDNCTNLSYDTGMEVKAEIKT